MPEFVGRLIGRIAACALLAGAWLGIPACHRIIDEVLEKHDA